MARYAYVYLNHTHLYNWSAPSCYFTKAALNDCYSEVTAYTAQVLTLIGLVSATRMDAYITPTTDTDYSCHIKAIELI